MYPSTRMLKLIVLAGSMLGGPGCISYFHSVESPRADLLEECQAHPRCCKDHVYIFFVHGLDPVNFANLNGVRDFVQQLGFHKTYYGQLYHTGAFEQNIRDIHAADPEAHFVLVGFSFGANQVRTIAQAVRDEDIQIDLLFYLGGNTLENTEEDQPPNALRIVNVLASGCIWNGAKMDRAENIDVEDVWHFGSPTHPRSREALARYLAEIAGEVPAVMPAEAPPMFPADQAPTPRPVMKEASAPPPGWDFLKPVSRLRPPPPLGVPAETPPRRPEPEKIAARG